MLKKILNYMFPQPVEVSTFVGDNKESLTRLCAKLDSIDPVDGVNNHIDFDDFSDVDGEEMIGDEWMEYPAPKL
jgi:hypothetical protein